MKENAEPRRTALEDVLQRTEQNKASGNYASPPSILCHSRVRDKAPAQASSLQLPVFLKMKGDALSELMLMVSSVSQGPAATNSCMNAIMIS